MKSSLATTLIHDQWLLLRRAIRRMTHPAIIMVSAALLVTASAFLVADAVTKGAQVCGTFTQARVECRWGTCLPVGDWSSDEGLVRATNVTLLGSADDGTAVACTQAPGTQVVQVITPSSSAAQRGIASIVALLALLGLAKALHSKRLTSRA